MSDVVPFNRTRSFIAWREAKSLPYNGYGLHAIQPSARFRYVAGGEPPLRWHPYRFQFVKQYIQKNAAYDEAAFFFIVF